METTGKHWTQGVKMENYGSALEKQSTWKAKGQYWRQGVNMEDNESTLEPTSQHGR